MISGGLAAALILGLTSVAKNSFLLSLEDFTSLVIVCPLKPGFISPEFSKDNNKLHIVTTCIVPPESESFTRSTRKTLCYAML